jgi:uncharacterized coiled-coil protein SlyX
MLLNEFLKEHRKNEEQQATIAQLKSTDAKQETTIAKQQKQIDALTVGLQKVSGQLGTGPRAHAFRSRCRPRRKRESQHDVSEWKFGLINGKRSLVTDDTDLL